jgi:hypothetical protein
MKGSYILFEFILRCPVRRDVRHKDRRIFQYAQKTSGEFKFSLEK